MLDTVTPAYTAGDLAAATIAVALFCLLLGVFLGFALQEIPEADDENGLADLDDQLNLMTSGIRSACAAIRQDRAGVCVDRWLIRSREGSIGCSDLAPHFYARPATATGVKALFWLTETPTEAAVFGSLDDARRFMERHRIGSDLFEAVPA